MAAVFMYMLSCETFHSIVDLRGRSRERLVLNYFAARSGSNPYFLPHSEKKEQEQAAVRIQANFRGHKARKELAEQKEEPFPETDDFPGMRVSLCSSTWHLKGFRD